MIIISALISFVISFVISTLIFRAILKAVINIRGYRDDLSDPWVLDAFTTNHIHVNYNSETSDLQFNKTRKKIIKSIRFTIYDYTQEIALLTSFLFCALALALYSFSYGVVAGMFVGLIFRFFLLKPIHPLDAGGIERFTKHLLQPSIDTMYFLRTLVRIVIFLAMIAVFVFLFWYLSNR